MLLFAKRLLGRTPKALEVAPEAPIAPDPVADDLRFQMDRLKAEWAELQLHWAEVLDKITAWANRQAARDRKAFGKSMGRLVEREGPDDGVDQAEGTARPEAPMQDIKADLRRRVAAMGRRFG